MQVVRSIEKHAALVEDMGAVVSAVESLKLATEEQAQAWQRELGPVLAARDAFLALNMPAASGGALARATDLIDALEAESNARKALDDAIEAKASGLFHGHLAISWRYVWIVLAFAD
jgi:hypothetical protein